MADLIGLLDAELARGLFAIDRACVLAQALQGQSYASSIARALAARAAIQAAGIELPPLRERGHDFEDIQGRRREEAAFLLKADLPLTTREIADLAQVDRTSIVRWANRLGGTIWAKYRSARRQGEPVRFTAAEVRAILEKGGATGAGE